MSEFLSTLGYFGAFLGSCLEGEVALITALQTARLGYTNLYGILLAGFLGTVFMDWSLFFTGRYRGKVYLESRPKLQSKLERMNGLLETHASFLLLFYRFMYGFRLALPLLFGLSHIPIRKFALFSLCATLLWLGLICCIGNYLGAWLGIIPAKV